jgi:hypothetical protein
MSSSKRPLTFLIEKIEKSKKKFVGVLLHAASQSRANYVEVFRKQEKG